MKRIGILFIILMMILCGAQAEGSWSQINREPGRPDGWTQIVGDPSAFALGGKRPYENGSEVQVGEWGTYPSMDGSTVCVPMAMEFARQWLGLNEEDLKGFVSFSTTPNAYDRLTRGLPNPMVTILSENVVMDDTHPIDLVIGTEANADEKKAARLAGRELVFVPVCCDAFVFFISRDNPVDSLTTEQIRDIYSGTVTEADGFYEITPYIRDWSEVGGEAGKILAFQRPHGSGSQTAMEELVMKDREIIAAEENYITGGMAEIVHRVGNYEDRPNSIGYSYLYYLNALYVEEEIKVIRVDGIEPTAENIQSGRYPFSVHYMAVYEKGNDNAERFVQWMTSDEGQKCIEQAGYIPLR
ncbi:MAG: substrate-binding domain-containing protein [Clostridia bacterium]|nr:substrate-binding domain-containing protein [Clostridia bacterium]